MCIESHIQVNVYHVSAQGVDERMMNVHYYYYYYYYYTEIDTGVNASSDKAVVLFTTCEMSV